jgi:pimeloyl-ACP methyl ester carboxylesterase
MSAITNDGNIIHYEVLGRGRPVILLHGWLGSWRYWIPTMQLLQTKYRVYAIDLYGFGDSAKDPAHYGIEKQVALLDDFMRQLGIPKAAVIGHGLGALIAAEFTKRNIDRVPRLLVTDAPLFDPGDLQQRVPNARKPQPAAAVAPAPVVTGLPSKADMLKSASAAAIRAAMQEAAAARARTASSGAQTATVTQAELAPPAPAAPTHNPLLALLDNPEALLARCFRRSEPNYEKLSVDLVKIDPQVFRKSVEGFDSGRMLDTLRLLTVPTVLIHGGDDPLIPPPNEDILNYITQDKEQLLLPIVLPNARHFPMLEDDRFARLANEFLEIPDISKLEIKGRWRRRTR